jgi:hypothetical protein
MKSGKALVIPVKFAFLLRTFSTKSLNTALGSSEMGILILIVMLKNKNDNTFLVLTTILSSRLNINLFIRLKKREIISI